MATFLKGIHGAYSGKVGNVVGSRWREVDYVRSLGRPSNRPASEAQLQQRARFALAVAFLSPVKDLLNLGFSDKEQNAATGYNVALSHLLRSGITGDYPKVDIDYSKVQISRGSLAAPVGLTFTEESPGEAVISWEPLTNTFNAFADDSVIALVYNKDKAFFSIYEEATRQEGVLSLELPAAFSGDELEAWVFMGHRDGVRTSNSQYAGQIIVS